MTLRSGAEFPWHWQAESGRNGNAALTTGELTGEDTNSWLELTVKGPDRLYFWSRTEMEPVTLQVVPYFFLTDWQATNWWHSNIRYGVADIYDPNHPLDRTTGGLPLDALSVQRQDTGNSAGSSPGSLAVPADSGFLHL